MNTNQEKPKKRSIVNKYWKRLREVDWKDPLNRWKLLLFSIIAFFSISASTYGAFTATSTVSFCSSCHEMSPEYVTHVSTSHSEVKCTKCHIEPGLTNTVIGKIQAMKEVYRHVTRTQPNPITLPHAMNDVVCMECHSMNRIITPPNNLVIEHTKHIEAGITCVTCHIGVAHARVIERGLNTADTYDYWIYENADRLIGTEYIRTNMGTCIDCHAQVNAGKQPWEDEDYIVPTPANALEEPLPTSNEIIENVIRKQRDNVELSMECTTCHEEMSIPSYHYNQDWAENHEQEAFEQLNQCLTCHQEQKWIKPIPPQSIDQLLRDDKPSIEEYEPNDELLQFFTRNNTFCYTCHIEKIENYDLNN